MVLPSHRGPTIEVRSLEYRDPSNFQLILSVRPGLCRASRHPGYHGDFHIEQTQFWRSRASDRDYGLSSRGHRLEKTGENSGSRLHCSKSNMQLRSRKSLAHLRGEEGERLLNSNSFFRRARSSGRWYLLFSWNRIKTQAVSSIAAGSVLLDRNGNTARQITAGYCDRGSPHSRHLPHYSNNCHLLCRQLLHIEPQRAIICLRWMAPQSNCSGRASTDGIGHGAKMD